MIVVITTPIDQGSLADAFLPPTTHMYTRGLISYRVYSVEDGEIEDQELFDPIDGSLIIGYRSFSSQDAALTWIRSAELVQ